MTSNLKDINFGINQFCGPAVLSALTGKSTDECAAVISSINGRQEIRAVEIKDLIKALEKLRFDVSGLPLVGCTLYRAFSLLVNKPSLYIILIPRHVIAVEVKDNHIFLIDNHSKSPIDAAHSARLMQKVEAVYRVISRGESKLISRSISIDNYNNIITIKALNIYEDVRDNYNTRLGNFSYTNISELEEIINELAKIGQTS